MKPEFTSGDGEKGMLFSVVRDPGRGMEFTAERAVTELAIGTAGEHVVCADLLLQGYMAFMSDQNCAYDVVAEVDGRLVRIQVKTTLAAKLTPQRRAHIKSYQWNVRRAGKLGARVYGDDEFDLLALVGLDIRRVAYLPPSKTKQTILIRPLGAGKSGRHFDDFPFDRAVRDWLAAA